MRQVSKAVRNVLFFFGDQHRADCLGCYGNPVVKTPVMDQMAKTGVRFTNAFTPAPTCTPARACLQTGQLAHEHGIIFNPEFQPLNGGAVEFKDDAPLFARDLKAAGYQMDHIGKWHVGHHSGESTSKPSDLGYDGEYYLGYGFPTHPYPSKHYNEYLKGLGVSGFNIPEPVRAPEGSSSKSVYGGIQEGPKEASVPYYLATQAVERIRSSAKSDAPFFLETHFWGPHSPYFLPEEVYEMYAGIEVDVWKDFGMELTGKPDAVRTWGRKWGIHSMDEEMLADLLRRYYAYITHIDECMGMVIEALKDTGRLDETLLIYSADHGSYAGSHNAWDKGYGMYDCLVKVPMILSHPSFTPSVNTSNVSLLDLPATFRDVAGLEPDERTRGGSLLPIGTGDTESVHSGPQILEHFGHTVPFAQRMVRTDQHKYICNSTCEDEFYDLQLDPHEITNIISSADATIVGGMKKQLLSWMRETGDTMGLRFMASKLC